MLLPPHHYTAVTIKEGKATRLAGVGHPGKPLYLLLQNVSMAVTP
jgi:hypothetical protein